RWMTASFVEVSVMLVALEATDELTPCQTQESILFALQTRLDPRPFLFQRFLHLWQQPQQTVVKLLSVGPFLEGFRLSDQRGAQARLLDPEQIPRFAFAQIGFVKH